MIEFLDDEARELLHDRAQRNIDIARESSVFWRQLISPYRGDTKSRNDGRVIAEAVETELMEIVT